MSNLADELVKEIRAAVDEWVDGTKYNLYLGDDREIVKEVAYELGKTDDVFLAVEKAAVNINDKYLDVSLLWSLLNMRLTSFIMNKIGECEDFLGLRKKENES